MGMEGWIFIFLCGAFFLLGWPRGLTRSAISLGGSFIAALLGCIIGKVFPMIWGVSLPWPPFYVEAAVGLVVFVVIKSLFVFFTRSLFDLLDAIVCEWFDDAHSFKGRLLYGLAGATMGLINGLLIIGVCLALVLATGNVAEAEVAKSGRSPNWGEVAVMSFSKGIKGHLFRTNKTTGAP